MPEPLRYAVIGSSHLFGLIQRYVEPMESGRFDPVWRTGTPMSAELPLDTPGWRGDIVLYNTPVAGPAPTVKDGVLYMPPQLSTVLAHIASDTDCIFSLMRGQEFAVASLVDDPAQADFSLPGSPCEPGRQWISLDDAKVWVRQIAAPLLGINLALKQHFPRARIIHVPAPPPIESEAHIRQNAEGFAALFERHGVKPFAMRQRLYRLMYDTLNRELAGYGIESLALPAAALTPAGGLKADYARGCLHGNEHYGRELSIEMTRSLAHASI